MSKPLSLGDQQTIATAPASSPRLRILILCFEFPPVGGGGSQVVAGLAAELMRCGHRVEVLTGRWSGREEADLPEGLVIHEVAAPRRRHDRSAPLELLAYCILALPRLRCLVRAGRYDVHNVHFVYPDGLVAWAAGIGRTVLTVHGSDVPGYNPERFKRLHWLLAPLWRKVINAVDIVVAPSATLGTLTRSAGARRPLRVIPNGFNPHRFTPQPASQPYILTVSRLFRRKGIHLLVEAHAKLDIPSTLHIVGDGPQRQELERLARQAHSDVHFWGWIDGRDQRLRQLYEQAAIFVLPSIAENFPVVLLEAMAAGLAIVTTRGTGCADVVGDTAMLVDPQDSAGLHEALEALLQNAELRRELGRRARMRLERRFAWDPVGRSYVEAFRAVTKAAA